MKCSNCGGELFFNNGVYVCKNCNTNHLIENVFENYDVFLCYVETDREGRRTKDSIIAAEIYKNFESKKISCFYERISSSNATGDELEIIRNSAIVRAKIIVIIGTNENHFSALYNNYREVFGDKKLIPVISDMKPEQLPEKLRSFQASNYDALGALNDLSASILNLLGRSKEVELEEIYNKKQKTKKIITISLVSFAMAIVCVAVIFLVMFLSKNNETEVVTNDDIYSNAMQLMNEEKYLEAVNIFSQIIDYKDSSNQIKKIYDRYDGYYKNDEQNCSLYLNISDAKQAEVIFEKQINGKILKIEETIFLKENAIKGSYIDNQSNKGNISIILNNDKIELSITSNEENNNLTIGNLNLQFFLKDKTDREEVKSVSKDMLYNWLTNLTSKDDVINAGFDLEELYEDEVNGVVCFDTIGTIFKIRNTNIILLMADAEWLIYEKCNISNNASGHYVVGVLAPASIVCPEKVGQNMGAYYESDLLYFPCDKEFKELYYKEGSQYAFYDGPGFFQNTVTTIENNSFIGAFSSNIIGQENYDTNKQGLLTTYYAAIALTEFNKQNNEDEDSWVYAFIESENNTTALAGIRIQEFREGTSNENLFYYKVDKATLNAVSIESEELEEVKKEFKSGNSNEVSE